MLYKRASLLFIDLAQARGEGRLVRFMSALERTGLLIIDDWGPEPLNAEQRRDLLEVVDARYDRGSLLVTSQIPGKRHYGFGPPSAQRHPKGIACLSRSKSSGAGVERGGIEGNRRMENPLSVLRRREPWNNGRLIGQKRPLKPKDVWTIRVRLQLEARKRDLAMFNLAVDSKLRGCGLVRLKIDDVSAGERVRDRATVIQRKTGRPVQFEITEQTRSAIGDWLSSLGGRRGQYLFPSRFRKQPHLSTANTRIVHQWVERAGLDRSAHGTHSMRRTKPAQIYKKTGNLRAVQLLLGHTKLESTVRYLGIEVDDALSISEQVDL